MTARKTFWARATECRTRCCSSVTCTIPSFARRPSLHDPRDHFRHFLILTCSTRLAQAALPPQGG